MIGPFRVLLTGGGTAGHVMPGLALAEALRNCGVSAVDFCGSGRPLERRLAREANLSYHSVACRPLARQVTRLLVAAGCNALGYLQARRLLRHLQPDVVVGLGGYASAPVAWAAVRAGLPLLLLEQNLTPGKVTRWLASRADLVCTSFAPTRWLLPDSAAVTATGNPVREAVLRAASQRTRRAEPSTRRLLVLGGSGGSKSLNREVPGALAERKRQLDGWRILHQSGAADVDATSARYASLGIAAEVTPFLGDLPSALADADLVVGRAGGTTLAELAVVGVPAVLVPYPQAAGDHQRYNALALASAGAAMLVDERDASAPFGQRLADGLGLLLDDVQARRKLARAIASQARPDAAETIADAVGRLAQRRRRVAA